MPRIPPTLLRHARRIDPLLPSLLPVCRDLQSSRNELRWLGEHAAEVVESKQPNGNQQLLLRQYVNRRARGEPLQYILGSEYFGHLEIKCRPEVLIPRQETAASVSHLANLLFRSWKENPAAHPVNFLDLCTGTGCIPLLLHHEMFSESNVNPNIARIVGVDISPKALHLAEENKSIQIREQETVRNRESQRIATLRNIQFVQADLLAGEDDDSNLANALLRLKGRDEPNLDYEVLISNPPYISSSSFRRTTSASVRKYEPKLALVPRNTAPPTIPEYSTKCNSLDDGDIFYPKLLEICDKLNTKVVLFEVADMEQASRVAAMAIGRWENVEIWRDDPGVSTSEEEFVEVGLHSVRVVGQGNGRSVVAYRGEGCGWMGR